MKATLYINNTRAQWSTSLADIRAMITRAFARIRRGENVRLEIN